MDSPKNKRAKPFVKWVGGKTQLINELCESLPASLGEKRGLTYVEPFVGGGAFLFWILQQFPNIQKAVINDINKHLMDTYTIIRDNVEDLIASLDRSQEEYLSFCDEERRKAYYLSKRDEFNSDSKNELETAALFIFLNRTCFNGLYRVNSKGKFNVPSGRYANPRICDADTLRADSKLLQKVEILCEDFSQTSKYATPDTIYYLDPPYKPLTETSAFTSYSSEGFNDSEQIRLRDFCEEISAKGALFIASNSDPYQTSEGNRFFDDIYGGFRIRRVSATRMVNCDPKGRGKLSELMITNIL